MTEPTGPSAVAAAHLIMMVRADSQLDTDRWFEALQEAPTIEIIHAIGGLRSTEVGQRTEELAPLRDSARALIEQRQTERMVAQMERLEKQANRLQRVAIIVAIIFGAVTIAPTILGWVSS